MLFVSLIITLHQYFCIVKFYLKLFFILKTDVVSSNFSTYKYKIETSGIQSSMISKNLSKQDIMSNLVTFSPKAIITDLPRTRYPIPNIIESPNVFNIQINDPVKSEITKGDIESNKIVEMPATNNIIEKHAVRMIRIRRKKMKKHKRKKWLKKYKFLLRKRKQKKASKREKRYQAEMQEMIAKAQNFDAKEYVQERIEALLHKRLPNKWKGVRVSEDMIKQFIKEREDRKAYKKRLRYYRLKLDE